MTDANDATVSALETARDRFLETGLGTAWSRFAPLSAGAIGGAVVIVAGTELLRRALRMQPKRRLWLWGALALTPLAARVLADASTSRSAGREEMGKVAGPEGPGIPGNGPRQAERSAAVEGDGP